MLIDLRNLLSGTKEDLSISANIEMNVLNTGISSYDIADKSPVELSIKKVGKNKLTITGKGNMTLIIPCDRCLEPVNTDIEYIIDKNVDLSQDSEGVEEQEEQHNKLVKEEDELAIKINNILCYYYTQKTGKDVLVFNKIGVNRCDADIVMGIYSDSLINNSNPENFNTNYFNKRLKDYNMSFSYGGYDIECNKDGKYLMKKK